MLLDPSQIVGHVRVDSGLVAVTTARAPADDSAQGELMFCSSFLTHQGAPGITLGGEQAARVSCPMLEGQGPRYQPGPQG